MKQRTDRQKRLRSKDSTPGAKTERRKAKLENLSFKEALTAIVEEGFLRMKMEPRRLKATEASILRVYEEVPREGLPRKIRFHKSTYKRYFVVTYVTCADNTIAGWLMSPL